MLAELEVCKKEYSPISSGEMVRFIARACSECVWDHLYSSAFRLEKVRRRITVGNEKEKLVISEKTKGASLVWLS